MLVVQFLGNSVGVLLFHYIRGERSSHAIPWKIPFFPLPCILQIIIFSFVLLTTPSYLMRGEKPIIELALAFLAFGVACFFAWSRKNSSWPFKQTWKGDPAIDTIASSIAV